MRLRAIQPDCGSHSRLGSGSCFQKCGQHFPTRHLSAGGRKPRSAIVAASKAGGRVQERGDDDARDGSAGASSSSLAGDDADSQNEPTGRRSDTDWRSFRAKLIRNETSSKDARLDDAAPEQGLQETSEVQWAHQIANPEKGCLLVAKRGDLDIFSNTVILILEHSDKIGSIGLILNLPMKAKVSDVATATPGIKGVFGSQRLFYGGPITNFNLYSVHSHAGLNESREVLPGVWCGGLSDAAERVLAGTLAPKGFRLLTGTSGWGPYQLSNEVLEGSWFVVAASNTVVQDFLNIETCQKEMVAPVRDRMWLQLLHLAQLPLPGL